MIDVQVTKEKVHEFHRCGEEYSLQVHMTQRLETRQFIDQCMVLARHSPSQEYIIDKMVNNIANIFRERLRDKVFQAMSNPPKQVWSN